MTGKIQKFLWAMDPSHSFPRTSNEDDETYIARYTMHVETLAADCIDSIKEIVDKGDVLDYDVKKQLEHLLAMSNELSFSENTSDEPLSNYKFRVCRNAMTLIRHRLIVDVLNKWPKPEKAPSAKLDNDVLEEKQSESKVISGTVGLAKFLGCGKTKAFEIIKSGVLLKNNIQYLAGGNTWRFNTEMLKKYIAEHPEGLK